LPAEKWLLALLAHGAEDADEALGEIGETDFASLRSAPVLRAAKGLYLKGQKVDAAALSAAVEDEGARRVLSEVAVEALPEAEVSFADELDDIFSMFGSMGIEVVDSEQKYREKAEGEEGAELDLTPGALDKTNDPVRMYLREMGTVPLLTREGEVEIAKRIERGQLRVLKAISRSPIVINELLALGEDLKKSVRSIKEVVTFDEEEITDEILQNRLKEFTGKIDDLAKAYKK